MAYSDIKDPSAHFQIKTGVGASSPQSHTFDGNSDLQPDLLWWKRRDASGGHTLHDSTRGRTKFLYASADTNEQTDGNLISSFDTNGWSTGSSWFDLGSQTWVTWAWKANGGTTSSNTDGNITSTVQSNQDAGFSIVTYTGNGSNNQTIGHGLGVQPSWWVVKNRSGGSTNWLFGASSILGGTSNYLKLNDTSANTEYNNIWGDSPTSSTLFRVSNLSHLNTNGSNYVAYLFADKQGYSKFGSYVGNGNTNGPFIYTGFKPAVIIHKSITTVKNWGIITGGTFKNEIDARLNPNLLAAEGTGTMVDFLSNGFKWRTTNGTANTNGTTYIYMAWAENPFVAGGVPTTAR
jgi:hypothetical protein